MKLVALAMVKDEIELIELFVRHTLHLADGLLVVDNASTDGTRERLAGLAAEGLPLTVIDDPRPARLQAERMTALYRRTARVLDVDHFLLLDADELLRVESRAALERALAALPADGFARIPWQTYVPVPERARAGAPLLERMRWRRRVEAPLYSKVALPAAASWTQRAVVMPGNHDLRTDRDERPPGVALDGVSIAHFPVRSAAQLETKVITGWLSQRALGPEARGNYHFGDLYRLLCERRFSEDDASRIAMHYAGSGDLLAPFAPDELVEDPVASEAAACAAGGPGPDPLPRLARLAASLVGAPPAEAAVLGRLRGAGWRRRRRRLESIGLGTAFEAGGLRALRDRFRPRSLWAPEAGWDGALGWWGEHGATRVVRGGDPAALAAEERFDLVLWSGAPGARGAAAAQRARGPILCAAPRAAGGSWLDDWQALGFSVDGWLSASLAVLNTPDSRCPPAVLLVRRGEQTPGPFDRAALRGFSSGRAA